MKTLLLILCIFIAYKVSANDPLPHFRLNEIDPEGYSFIQEYEGTGGGTDKTFRCYLLEKQND